MRRAGWPAWGVALLALAVVALPPSRAADVPPEPAHVGRAFAVLAEAYPTQSAPGTQDTDVKVRTASSKAVASNPPVGAFAHASAADLGLAEAYVGRQGPSADADTATQGDEDDVVITQGGSRMEAHVDGTPKASSAAQSNAAGGEPGGTGSVASVSTADGSGARLVATAEADLNDFRLGPLVIGSGRFEAAASIDGTPGGGRAAGLIRTSDATYAGIPITLGADGVQVDETRVPDPLLGPSTAAIQQAFSPGGYMDLRVVQPQVEIAEDGTAARVFGGGIFVYLTNNSPTEKYFFSYTLLGGTTAVEIAGILAQPTPDRAPVASPIDPAPQIRDLFHRPGATAAPRPTGRAATAPELRIVLGSERVALPDLWAGWTWALVLVGLGWGAAGALRLPPLRPLRAKLSRGVNDLADRYLRG